MSERRSGAKNTTGTAVAVAAASRELSRVTSGLHTTLIGQSARLKCRMTKCWNASMRSVSPGVQANPLGVETHRGWPITVSVPRAARRLVQRV